MFKLFCICVFELVSIVGQMCVHSQISTSETATRITARAAASIKSNSINYYNHMCSVVCLIAKCVSCSVSLTRCCVVTAADQMLQQTNGSLAARLNGEEKCTKLITRKHWMHLDEWTMKSNRTLLGANHYFIYHFVPLMSLDMRFEITAFINPRLVIFGPLTYFDQNHKQRIYQHRRRE